MEYYYNVERSAKTDEEARSAILLALKEGEEIVNIDFVRENGKGILSGIIGSRQTKAKARVAKSTKECAIMFIESIVRTIRVDAELEVKESENRIFIDIKGKDVGVLIGKRGNTLDSIQYLTRLVANKGKQNENKKDIIVDVGGYREAKEESLIKAAKMAADKVVGTGRDYIFNPMRKNERRVIHKALQDNKMVETRSVGNEEEFDRRIIVKLR